MTTPSSAPLLQVEGLDAWYDRSHVVQGLSLTVHAGEIVTLMGRNGAGKTTTLRILLGLLHPDGGTAKIGGHDCWTDHVRAAGFFGATLEQPGFYGFLSGRDNLRQFARMLGPVDEKQVTEFARPRRHDRAG